MWSFGDSLTTCQASWQMPISTTCSRRGVNNALYSRSLGRVGPVLAWYQAPSTLTLPGVCVCKSCCQPDSVSQPSSTRWQPKVQRQRTVILARRDKPEHMGRARVWPACAAQLSCAAGADYATAGQPVSVIWSARKDPISWHGHTMEKTHVPVRSRKLSSIGVDQ